MDPKTLKIGLFVIFVLTLIIISTWDRSKETYGTITQSIVSNYMGEDNGTDVEYLPGYQIDGMDRFEWYEKQWKKELKDKQPPKVNNLTLLSAYEYDVEYAISLSTPFITNGIVYCRYFDINRKEIGSPVKSFSYPEYIVNCPKRRGTMKISLSAEQNGTYPYPIPLNDRSKRQYTHELSFCMSTIYGKEPKWLHIAEIIEHYKLQGVQKFYFYVFHIDEYSSAILNDYVRTGDVDVTYFLERDDRALLHWQIVAYRDCTLRTRWMSKWSIFHDIDERLIMTQYPGNILDYVREIKDQSVGGIIFRQRWILKTEFMPEKYEGDKQIDEWSPTLRWHNTSAVGPPMHTVKTIVMPEKTIAMWTHYPKIMYPGYKLYSLKPEEGIIRHYRDQTMWNWGNTWLKEILAFGPFSLTNYPEKYQKDMIDNVKKRTKYVYSNYNPRLEN